MKQVCTALLLLLLASMNLAQAEEADTTKIIGLIQQGGYVLYFRHAHTDHNQADSDRSTLSDCATQRNLDEQGRREATAIGQAFKTLKIPVGKVLSSPYCRTKETATLAFGRVEVTPELGFSISKNQQETDQLAQALKRMLATAPNSGVNTVLVSHSGNLKDAADVWLKPEAAMAVFKPHDHGSFEFVGIIAPDAWPAMVEK